MASFYTLFGTTLAYFHTLKPKNLKNHYLCMPLPGLRFFAFDHRENKNLPNRYVLETFNEKFVTLRKNQCQKAKKQI